MKPFIDKNLNKYMSRKLIVFIISTIALFCGNLTSADWITVSVVYIAAQGAVDIVERLRK